MFPEFYGDLEVGCDKMASEVEEMTKETCWQKRKFGDSKNKINFK
jgi:hypothetical protein